MAKITIANSGATWMKSNVFTRLWTRLWDTFSKSWQAGQSEVADAKATQHQPAGIREVIKEGRAGMDILEEYAVEQEVSQGHRREYAEAFMNLTRSLANAATIIGPAGGNIKVLLFADPDFIYEVLTEGQPPALEKAFKRLDMEQRARYARWIFGADLERVVTALNLLETTE